jgi:glycosyltransferase involved in cell wall biosynthesis
MDGSAGVLVAVGDVGAMAKQGVRLLTDQAFAQGLADEATAHLFRFHPEACYQAYLEILES